MSGYAARGNRRKYTAEEQVVRQEKRHTIPAKEAKRLNLETEEMEVEEAPVMEMSEAPVTLNTLTTEFTLERVMRENMLAGAIVDGVKRQVVRPMENRRRKVQKPRAKMTGSKRK